MAENESTVTYNILQPDPLVSSTEDGDLAGFNVRTNLSFMDCIAPGAIFGFCRFVIHDEFTPDRSIPVDPRLATGISLLLVVASVYSGVGGILTIYGRSTADSANAFSEAGGAAPLLNQVSGTITIPTSLATGTLLTIPLDITEAAIRLQTSRSNWNGKLGYSLHFNPVTGTTGSLKIATSSHTTLTGPQLQYTSVSFLTGIVGDVKAQSRVDRCDKCGHIDIRERFVMDGFSPGLWVCKECYDPAEPTAKVIPPDSPPING